MNGVEMKEAALQVIQRLSAGAIVVPVQTFGELFNVLVLKSSAGPPMHAWQS